MEKAVANRGAKLGIALLIVCLLGVGLALAVRQSRIRHQWQTDPAVATVWLMQVTHGPNHTVTRGSAVQRWANAHGVHALGDYQVLTSSFNGDPNGIQFWFDYDSYTSVKELECHRVGATAFVDDLGQVYHGYLDLQGKTVGVYLPGYDHAAHTIRCIVHWMPRRPHAPSPVSHPMTFTTPLPVAHRTLLLASALPAGPVSVTKKGITVTVSEAHLGPVMLRPFTEGQRDLMFQVHVQGGEIADENVTMSLDDAVGASTNFSGGAVNVRGQVRTARGQIITTRIQSGNTVYMLGNGYSAEGSFAITDPYGISLVPDSASVAMPVRKPRKGQKASPFWVAPVNGTGRGTDCVLLHFHVQPPSRSSEAMPPALVSFEIPVRVAPSVTP